MQSIIINFYSIIDFHSKFCQGNRGISNYIENYSELPPSAGEGRGFFFLTLRAMVSSTAKSYFESVLGAEFPVCKGSFLIFLKFCLPQRLKKTFQLETSTLFSERYYSTETIISFAELVFHMFLLWQVLLTTEVVLLITHDYCWLFS